jgi:transcriptional regulator with XRE-family HTH domain
MELLKELKQMRKKQGLTLSSLAKKSGLSTNYLSQVERGVSNPSIGTLKKITDSMNITLMSLVGSQKEEKPELQTREIEETKVVKSEKRKMLVYPGGQRKAFLLTPDLQRRLEVLLTEENPQTATEEEWYSHEGEEFGFILEGRYEVTIDDRVYILEEGDSICFSSRLPHKMRCIGGKPAKTIWVITPPSF